MHRAPQQAHFMPRRIASRLAFLRPVFSGFRKGAPYSSDTPAAGCASVYLGSEMFRGSFNWKEQRSARASR